MKDGETGAFLVWGDPMLYDSTIRNLDALKEAGLAFDYEVIPGITAIQALAAAHKIPLNRIAEAVTASRRAASSRTASRRASTAWSCCSTARTRSGASPTPDP